MQRLNTGPAFYHPVTQQLIESGQWYEGFAHRSQENEVLTAVSDVLTENAVPQEVISSENGKLTSRGNRNKLAGKAVKENGLSE